MAKYPYELQSFGFVIGFLLLNIPKIPGQNYDPTETVHIPKYAYKYYGSTVLTYVQKQVSWNEASEICRTLYASGAGTLVRIDSFEEQEAVREVMSLPAPWIGLHWHVQGNKESLVWADPHCTDLDDEAITNFDAEAVDFDTHGRCFYMKQVDGLWMKSSCNALRPFVCEHQDVNHAPNCPSSTKNGFFMSNARVEAVAENGANPNKCTRNCNDVQGCFMVYPGHKECIMAISDESESLFIKDTCFTSSYDTGASVDYSTNANQSPETCQTIDTNFLTGGVAEATAVVQPEVSSSTLCPASTLTLTSTVTESSPCVTYSTIVEVRQPTSTCVVAPTATVTAVLTTTVTESPFVPDISLSPAIQQVITVTTTETLTTPSTIISTVLLNASPDVITTTVISTLPVTLTTTAVVTSSSKAPVMCDTTTEINATSTLSSVDIHSLTSAIVKSLKMEATSFSSYRRTKESVNDERVSSKISGAVAISVLALTFGTVIAMDITMLAPDLLKLSAKIASK